MQPHAPLFHFEMPSPGSQDGVAASDDKLYRWAFWRFWDVSKSYITFVALNPRAHADPMLEDKITGWLERWEGGRDKSAWTVGGYVVVSMFGRVAPNVPYLRRLHASGVDIAGQRAADACLVFARNPSCRMIVMLPGIDDMIDVREPHQRLILSALVGLDKHVTIIDPETQMPRAYEP
jgi:hypothetical protein